MHRFVLALLPALASATGLVAATWHVDASVAAPGDGGSRAAAFSTIQRGVDAAQAGDTIVVYPGIYYEQVDFGRGGAADAPITLKADEVGKDRVVISGAAPEIRRGETPWELVDASLGLYRVPLAHRPARVLAGRADLLPYPSLADLKAFRYLEADYPGHPHGFAWDADGGSLYVRLRADGKYGPVDPNLATMAVSPPTGGGRWGRVENDPKSYNLALRFRDPANVIVDGFTFETPGIAAVYSEAGDLTVRNCWFYGCRIGVAGFDGKDHRTDRVTVEQCYVTHYPAFSDIADTIATDGAAQRARKDSWQHLAHWQRKGGFPPTAKDGTVGRAYSYEIGLISRMGEGWIVRRNHFFEVFEGLSNGATSRSTGAQIYGNRFERICDNAIETEDHARDLHFYRNLIVDTFEPFSWQPLDRGPLPGPVYIHDNIVWQTPETAAMWTITGNNGGFFKLGVKEPEVARLSPEDLHDGAVAAPGGFWAVHNTLLTTEGNLITRLNSPQRAYAGFVFLNNLVVAKQISQMPRMTAESGIVFDHNLVAPVAADLAGPGAGAAGPGGRELASIDDFGWSGPLSAEGRFAPGAESPAHGAGFTGTSLSLPDGRQIVVPSEIKLRGDAGAEAFDTEVGPRPR